MTLNGLNRKIFKIIYSFISELFKKLLIIISWYIKTIKLKLDWLGSSFRIQNLQAKCREKIPGRTADILANNISSKIVNGI